MNESAGGSLKSDSMSCVRPGASLTHASRPVRGGRPGWQLQHRVHDQDQWESEEGELMQLTVETKMSTAMEVRKASTSEQKIPLITSWLRGSNVVGVWRA